MHSFALQSTVFKGLEYHFQIIFKKGGWQSKRNTLDSANFGPILSQNECHTVNKQFGCHPNIKGH